MGQYEILIGRASGEVDPKDPRNAGIVYIAAAPRNARGMVEYDVDLFILKPVNMDRGTQTIFYGVNNRGGKPYFPGKDGGDGFLTHGPAHQCTAALPRDALVRISFSH